MAAGALVPAATLRRLALLGATFSATAPLPTPRRSSSEPKRSTTSSAALLRLAGPAAQQRGLHVTPRTLSHHSALPLELDVVVLDSTSPVAARRQVTTTSARRAAPRPLVNHRQDLPSPALLFSSCSSSSRMLRQRGRPNRSPSRALSWTSLFQPNAWQFEGVLQTSGGLQLSEMETSNGGGGELLPRMQRDERGSAGGGPGGDHWEPPKETNSPPSYDEINTLLRHPTLYDPVLAPRHPLVLCHGLYGFDVRGPTFFRLHYWGDLLKILRGTVGAEVFVTAVPGTGSIKHRAHVLHKSLEETAALQGKDFNFIAHSMGGLDARYLLSDIRPTSYIPRSLTTMSTPHRGSEFMAWCRANIGIGTDFDANSEAAARALHEDDTSIPLPYSLKAPILSRAQVEAAKRKAAEDKERKTKAMKEAADQMTDGFRLPGLPYSLSASVSSYLLDILDSPAYANLTPAFLREVFNPQTPDRDDVKYYSVASRIEKIPIWHPLWLPKQVLDGAEVARQAKGNGAPERWRGNDGLVSVESAKWGQFLGVVENCDHWEMRGSSGLVSAAASAKAMADVSAHAVGAAVNGDKNSSKSKGWQWQDLYALIGSGKSTAEKAQGSRSNGDKDMKAEKVGFASEEIQGDKGLASVAAWVIKRLPAAVGITTTPSSPASASTSAPEAGSRSPSPSTVTSSPKTPASSSPSNQARMLYGAPAGSGAKPEKFNLERMTLAVCRKLYNDGL